MVPIITSRSIQSVYTRSKQAKGKKDSFGTDAASMALNTFLRFNTFRRSSPGGFNYAFTVFLAVFIFVSLPCSVHCADPVFEPKNISAKGHTADENSDITWGDLPEGQPYSSDGDSYQDGGLGPLFNAARGFVNVVQPNPFPTDLLLGVLGNQFNIGTDYMKVVQYAMGFAVCFAIGILFIIVMPVIGCCFCCCRCCGNCGGKMTQKVTKNTGCKRIAFCLTSFVLTAFMATGMVCTYVTSEHIMTAVRAIRTTATGQMDDLVRYMNNTVQEIDYLGPQGFNFTSQVILRDLDNVGYLVGIPVRTDLSTNGGVDNAINSIMSMESTIATVSTNLFAVNTSISQLKEDGATLSARLSTIKQNITDVTTDPLCTSCGIDVSSLEMNVDFNALPDISSEVQQMKDVASQNLTEKAIIGKKEFDDIPQRVQNETEGTLDGIRNMMGSMSSQIDTTLKTVNDMPKSIISQVDTYKKMVVDYGEMVEDYNQYRWYGSVGLCSTILIIVVLQFLGLLFGCVGSSKDTNPMERGCCSHCGGIMLMAACGFIFLFSVLLMLLTSISFLIGGNLEKLVCEPVLDPDLKTVSEVLDGPNGYFKKYILGDLLLKNGSIPLTFDRVLKDCEADKGAIEALKLDNLFKINDIINVRDSINIDSQLDAINVDLSSVRILSADTEKQLRDFSGTTGIDFDAFAAELDKNTTKANLTEVAGELDAMAAGKPADIQTRLQQNAQDLRDLESGLAQTVQGKKDQLQTDVQNLNSSMSVISNVVNSTIDNAKAVETYLQQNGSQVVKDEAKKYGARVLGIADSYMNHTLNKIMNDIGGCRPLYNLYVAIFDIMLCRYIVDTFNGFWFSLGWAIFFMVPSLIFNVKLAKHFRRMKDVTGVNDYPTKAVPPLPHQRNKVGPI